MANQNAPASQTSPKDSSKTTAPPEAHAAFVRIYMEWMEKNEYEQVEMIEHSVRRARSVMNAHSGGMFSGHWGKDGGELFGADFDEYVNTVWIDFREKCDDPNKFAEYLQKDFKKYMDKLPEIISEYNKLQDDFLGDVFAQWDADTENLSGEALDQYFADELPKREAEFHKLKENFERRYAAYPSLNTLLRRPAQNMMARKLNEATKAAKAVSLDDYTDGKKPYEIKDMKTDGLSQEAKVMLELILDNTLAGLSEQDQKIFVMKMEDKKQTEIAKKLNISDATVSNRLKKIVSKIHLAYNGGNTSNTGTP